jgi:hypothetical protein
MSKMKTVPASPAAEACRQALVAAIRPYADTLGPQGMLAVASALVGQLIAMQDQRTVTPKMAMDIVARNIEGANQEVLDGLRDSAAGSA